MAGVHPEVTWLPTVEDKFLIWSTNLQLYQVQVIDAEESISPPKIKLSDTTAAKLIATNSDYQFIKCVAWDYGIKEDPNQHYVAVGQENGRISVMDMQGPVGKEFIPKISRPVNALVWNPHHHHLLAAGLDKGGKDSSLIVLDIFRGFQTRSSKTSVSGVDTLRPILEWGIDETLHSVEFSRHDPQTLLTGVNNRLIKLYDLRGGKLITSVASKAVFTLTSDPFYSHRFASSFDNVVFMWDERNMDRPVLNLADSSNKAILKLAWCPTRCGFLGCLMRDSSSVRLYDIQQRESVTEDPEPAIITRTISPDSNALISSFSWHPTHGNRILTASYSGKVMDHIVLERVTLNISIRNAVVWSNGKGMLNVLDDSHPSFRNLSDISTVIKERALKKYGLQVKNLALNGEITNDQTLKNLWTWLEEAKKLVKDSNFKMPGSGGSYRYQGVWSILNSGTMKSDVVSQHWIGIEETTKLATVYQSEERDLGLALCSWGFEKEGSLLEFLDHLESTGFYTRAAAVAVFNLHIPEAIKRLERGAATLGKPALNTTAMALAGFTNERKALWRETCSSLLKHITDHYIRIMFMFLIGDTNSFNAILNEKLISIHDKVAFACKYLNDTALLEYVKSLKGNLLQDGNLDGILLAGLETEGQDLLQRYIDLTGDIQTPAFVTVHALHFLLESNDRLEHWVEQYRNLLDSLQLWKERAEMDVMMTTLSGDYFKKPSQQIYISCNFCLKSISAYIQAPGKGRNQYPRYGAAAVKSKLTACPNCRKPLPRCALCLQHMGTPSKRGGPAGKPSDQNLGKNFSGSVNALSKFGSWFTWCQCCRHGGHALHMMEWFRDHSECPVASCFCKCMSIDGVHPVGLQASLTTY